MNIASWYSLDWDRARRDLRYRRRIRFLAHAVPMTAVAAPILLVAALTDYRHYNLAFLLLVFPGFGVGFYLDRKGVTQAGWFAQLSYYVGACVALSYPIWVPQILPMALTGAITGTTDYIMGLVLAIVPFVGGQLLAMAVGPLIEAGSRTRVHLTYLVLSERAELDVARANAAYRKKHS